MKTNENNVKRIYDKQTKTWFEVTPEQYKEFDTWRTNLRKREQYHHRCMCPRNKWWLCDGMCDDCEYHAPGDILSLDMPTSNDDGDEVTLLDMLEDPAVSIEEVTCNKAELDQLFDLFNMYPCSGCCNGGRSFSKKVHPSFVNPPASPPVGSVRSTKRQAPDGR